jgi:hypothetical protein
MLLGPLDGSLRRFRNEREKEGGFPRPRIRPPPTAKAPTRRRRIKAAAASPVQPSYARCWAGERRSYAAAADLGLRPRRATAVPGILAAQSSQRSACFAPRRASEKLIRITAPRPSATSFEQLSQTSRVTRANAFPPSKGLPCDELNEKDGRNYAAARACRIRHERRRLSSACSSATRPVSRALTIRKCRGRKSSIVLPSRYWSTTAGLT